MQIEIINNLKTISSSTKEISLSIESFVNSQNTKTFFNEYQGFIGSLVGAFIPILFTVIWTFYLARKEKRDKEEDYCDALTFTLNKEINSTINYKENVKRQIIMLSSQKTTLSDLENNFIIKHVPILISNYSGLNIDRVDTILSGFIRQQLAFCKNDSDNFIYNAKLMSSQIENLYTVNDKFINFAMNSKRDSNVRIQSEIIRKEFDGGIDQLIKCLDDILMAIDRHSSDLITLLSSVIAYKNLHFSFFDIWKYKYSNKYIYKLSPWNLFYKKPKDVETFAVLYEHFKKEGSKVLKEIPRPN